MLKIGYKVFQPSRPILGIKYTVFFLILVFYTSFSIIFGILEDLFQVTRTRWKSSYHCTFSIRIIVGDFCVQEASVCNLRQPSIQSAAY